MTLASEVRPEPPMLLDAWLIMIADLANYLSDLWLFDTETYKWKQIEIRDADRAPR